MSIPDIESLLKAELASYGTSQWTGEIGGQEITLYAKPLSPADNSRVLRKFPNFNTTMEFGGMVEYIILKATDADGKRVFNESHRVLLSRMSSDKVAEIFNGLFGDQLEDDSDEGGDDKVGNS